jgi:hypothetical protein
MLSATFPGFCWIFPRAILVVCLGQGHIGGLPGPGLYCGIAVSQVVVQFHRLCGSQVVMWLLCSFTGCCAVSQSVVRFHRLLCGFTGCCMVSQVVVRFHRLCGFTGCCVVSLVIAVYVRCLPDLCCSELQST